MNINAPATVFPEPSPLPHPGLRLWHDIYVSYRMTSDKRVCRVLIVEDDDDLCGLLTLILQKNGPVHVEYTLKEAESHVREIDPMILFLDNNLPMVWICNIYDRSGSSAQT